MGLFSKLFGDKTVNGPNAEPVNLQQSSADVLGPIVMTIEDVFSIRGRGTVATGTVASGSARVGDQVAIMRTNGEQVRAEISGVESFKKSLDVAAAGQNVGLLFREIERKSIGKGDIVRGI